MSYELHITRRKHWPDCGDDILREEFESYVRRDVEFIYPSEMGPDYAEWISPTTGYESWLCWEDGQIQTKNPEPEFIDKIVAIAHAFNAVAQGDDSEVYLSSTTIRAEPSNTTRESLALLPRARSSPNWGLLLLALMILAVLLAKYFIF